MKQHFNELEKELKELTKRKATLESLKEKFPDLNVYTNRWKREFLYSKLALPLVNKLNSTCGCGCCGDVPLSAMVYTDQFGESIYAANEKGDGLLYVEIGWRDYSHRTRYHKDWDKRLRKAGVPEAAIESGRSSAEMWGISDNEEEDDCA